MYASLENEFDIFYLFLKSGIISMLATKCTNIWTFKYGSYKTIHVIDDDDDDTEHW